ncbi:trigger factor [Halodesulfovibrio sp. MK-HDV]|jgi:trigger factor|uniref:trigger factor n=1 Tax=Halodesulfovibrio sp. MK-HDV TaxID=2599925 RepID=UPI00136DCB88|nr:trigger factor [Halodesulfovibrio sp. MK-HDV]KAF1074599.1 Trigger factor [Halodesulfovibrio sp. MK-HDV]
MEYKVEDLSPVKKQINITVPVDEVNAALAATIAMYRTNVDLKGFRKGKVPTSVIEGRFKKEVYSEATQDLVNVHINEVIGEGELSPVSRIDFDGGELVRDEEFTYSISFEVMPAFDLPNYEGIEVEEEKVVVDEKEVDEVLDRIRGNMAENVVIAENRAAKDGEIAVIDFAAYENGEPLEGVSAENFQMTLGDKQALEDFETLVKSITVGEAGEGEVTFPEDFINPEFAGKTVTMKVTVHGIQEKKLPELNDELAKKAGGFDSIEKMREAVVESYKSSRLQLNKSQAQKTMLDSLLKTVDFPIPATMVDGHVDSLIQERIERLERQGKSVESLGKTPEELQAEVRPEAEEIAKTQVFLIAVAKKEGVEVADQEVDMQLHQIAQRAGQEFNVVKEYYSKNNLLFSLRDRLLADKAMDAIYEKANVTEVEPKKEEEKED